MRLPVSPTPVPGQGRCAQLLLNVSACVLFQLVVSYPTETLAILPALALMGLITTYAQLPPSLPIESRQTLLSLTQTLVFNSTSSGLVAAPPQDNAAAKVRGARGSVGADDVSGALGDSSSVHSASTSDIGGGSSDEDDDEMVQGETSDDDEIAGGEAGATSAGHAGSASNPVGGASGAGSAGAARSSPEGAGALAGAESKGRALAKCGRKLGQKAKAVGKVTLSGGVKMGKATVTGAVRVVKDPLGAVGTAGTLVTGAALKLPMLTVRPTLDEELERLRWEGACTQSRLALRRRRVQAPSTRTLVFAFAHTRRLTRRLAWVPRIIWVLCAQALPSLRPVARCNHTALGLCLRAESMRPFVMNWPTQ